MAKMRVHELAKELEIKSQEIIDSLSGTEYEIKSASNNIDDAAQEIIRKKYKKSAPKAEEKPAAEKAEKPAAPKAEEKARPEEKKPADAEHIPTRLATPFFTFFVSFCVFDFLTSFLTAIYTFLDTEAAVASEVIFLYIIRYCSIQTSREVYTAVDITPRNANTFLAQFVKSFGLKFCSKILGSILAKPPKHKM